MHECERRRVSGKKSLNRSAGMSGAKEFQKLFGSAHGECVDGVPDDIGVNMFGKMKAYCYAPRTAVIRIVVGDGREARAIRKSNRHRRGRNLYVRSTGK